MEIFGYVVIGIVGALLLFMILRTVFTRPKKLETSDYVAQEINLEEVTAHLVGAIQYETITMSDNSQDGSKFLAYQEYLESIYPLTMARAEKTLINKYAVIYKVKGSDESLLPVAVLAHQDVVPADEDGWECEPFSGEIKDGYIYGRGSQDMKSQMIVALDGMETLLRSGKELKRTVLFCFGHDEELRGTEGASYISEHLLSQGVRLEYVIDEGGTILDGSIIGINKKIALIGTCEKGYADFKLEVEKDGGHSSTPRRKTSVNTLVSAINRIEKHPVRPTWVKPVKDMFKALAPYMNPAFKFVLVNRDIFSPILKPLLCLISPFTNCLMRTTSATTQLKGASTPNTLPGVASANVNCRINIDETVESTLAHLQKLAGKNVKISIEEGYINPSPVSDIDSNAYAMLEKTIKEVYSEFLVAPYPFIAASDAKYYYKLTNNVYRFTPFEKTVEDANRIHGLNERIEIAQLVAGTRFFVRLFENTCC